MSLGPETSTKSNQGWRTPPAFLHAIGRRFDRVSWDLAATPGHQVTGPDSDRFFSPEQDSLKQDWTQDLGRVVFLNPPFATLAPWVAKVCECRNLQRWTLALVPASVGSNWYRDHVHCKSLVLFLSGRLTFVGAEAPYPKDCVLICAGFGFYGVDAWDWRK